MDSQKVNGSEIGSHRGAVRRRVLLVAMVDSVHVARWIAQFDGEDVEFDLFPSTPNRRIHPMIKERLSADRVRGGVRLSTWLRATSLLAGVLDLVFGHRIKARLLRAYASAGEYDFVHVLEFQHAGYIAERAWFGRPMPAPLIATNWGSDIFWFERFPAHRERIVRLLSMADYYSAECARDWALARSLGFSGRHLPTIPNAGGVVIMGRDVIDDTSQRRTVVVKGYSRFVGLAPRALKALVVCREALTPFDIVVYSASFRVIMISQWMRRRYGMRIRAIRPHALSHAAMLELFSESRVYIGLSKSDGISTALLEAMATGCFPIQTATSCADEWIVHGQTGMIVDWKDADGISLAITRALSDDELVNLAADLNSATIEERGSVERIRAASRTYYDLQ